jgi:tetratricopeptide (TPR) repeat protein
MTDNIEQLLAFGRMGLETGYYEQARGYFEQVLALDPSNREAMKGLARANEILSRRKAAAAEPTWSGPVEPQRRTTPVQSIPERRPEEWQRSPIPGFREMSKLDERRNSMESKANSDLEWLSLQLRHVSIGTWIVVLVKMGVAYIVLIAVLAFIAFVSSLVLAKIGISLMEVLSNFL